MPKKINKEILLYKISLQQPKKICKDIEQRKRLNYYKENPIIITEQLPIILNEIKITFDTLFYDQGCNKISIKELDREELLKLYK